MRALTLFVAALVAGHAGAATLTGRVVGVQDGHAITVLDAAKAQHKIRIAGIYAPGLKQAYGTQSKEKLSELIAGKRVSVLWESRDGHGRIIGKVSFTPKVCLTPACLNQGDAGYEQVATGLAWHYKLRPNEQSRQDSDRYAAAESQARAAKSGLWADPAPVPPWESRKKKK